jgi:hypothetical protein
MRKLRTFITPIIIILLTICAMVGPPPVTNIIHFLLWIYVLGTFIGFGFLEREALDKSPAFEKAAEEFSEKGISPKLRTIHIIVFIVSSLVIAACGWFILACIFILDMLLWMDITGSYNKYVKDKGKNNVRN